MADWTDNQWITAFNDEAEKILSSTAQELGELKENDIDAYSEKFSEATFKSFIFKIRVKVEVFGVCYHNIIISIIFTNFIIINMFNYLQDENRLRATCLGVSPMDYKLYNNHLITQIKELVGIGKA